MNQRTASGPDPLQVSVAQMHCVPGDVAANLEIIEKLVALAVQEGAKLVILPEMATTGYFISDRLDELAEAEDGPTSRRLGEIAKRNGAYLVVGAPIRAEGKFFDAQLMFSSEGDRIATYRKAHLFSAEREWFSAGDAPLVVETPLGRIGMTVCYDLIFPEYVRKLADMGADLVINSTNWITDDFQRQRWGWDAPTVTALAKTRALENGVWLAMSCCVGPEAQFDSIGHSCIVAPSGMVVASLGRSVGIASHEAVFQDADLDRWRAIATYRSDRRPELY
ncbi:MAG: carbon-nitrogen hydrolase family protein [Roseovarius sp.]|uniref:carbon-nitrogen hydrolase family protein n=1 Tax=Roseovarius sp. TaxID=1486281 RepID=UPI0032EF3122